MLTMPVLIHERKTTPPMKKTGYIATVDVAKIWTVYKVEEHLRRLFWCAIGQFEPESRMIGGNGYLITLYEPYEQYFEAFRAEAEAGLIRRWEEKNPPDTWSYVLMDKYE